MKWVYAIKWVMDKFCFQNLNADRPLLTVAGNHCWLFVHYVSYFPHCCDKSSLNKGLLSLTAWREQVGVARMARWQEPEAAGLLVFTVRTQRERSRAGLSLPSSYPVQDPSPWSVLSAFRAGFHPPVQTRGLPLGNSISCRVDCTSHHTLLSLFITGEW